MAKKIGKDLNGVTLGRHSTVKGTSIGNGKIKTSSMNKTKARAFKKYRGQGR